MNYENYKKYQSRALSTHLTNDFKLKPARHVHVLGAGRSGKAAVKLLLALGMEVTLHEKDFSQISQDFMDFLEKNNIKCIDGEHNKESFRNCDILIPSPGVHLSTYIPYLEKLYYEKHSIDNICLIMSETELAWLYCKEIPLLAVTGTSGKTTTTTMCSAMLQSAGFNIFTGGNIGTPLSEFALDYYQNENNAKKIEVLVLELSSAQLQTCSLLRPEVAICLNITENHQDYHFTMDEYVSAKMNIFLNQVEEDIAIFGESMHSFHPHSQVHFPIKSKIFFFNSGMKRFPDMKLLGMHNQDNAEAAWLACKSFGVTEEQATEAMNALEPIENRLEFVKKIDGISYINDTKGTTVDAVKVALLTMIEDERPTCLLMGGKFKGGDLASLIPFMKKTVKHIALFGGSKDVFLEAYGKEFENNITWDTDLKTAIIRLQKIAVNGDTILLSPATSSFDQYKNYEMRGEDFRQIVHNLAK